MKIIHTGDLHFDNPPQLLAEIVKCTDYLAKAARIEQPDMIVISGDTFHESVELGSPAALAAMDFIRNCGEIAPTLIIRGTTTHDAPGCVEALGKLKATHPIYTTDRPCQIALTAHGFEEIETVIPPQATAVISCLPSVTKANILAAGGNIAGSTTATTDLLREMLKMWGQVNEPASVPTILVGHLTVTGSVTPTGQVMVGRDIELSTADLRLAKASLVCLGHIHKEQSWGEIFYCGSITRLNHGEANDPKGFYIHELPGNSLSSCFIETPARTMRTRRPAALPTLADVADVQPGEYVRLVYEINDDQIGMVDEQAIIKTCLDAGAADVKIEKLIIPKNTARAEGISRLTGTKEKLCKWAELSGVTLTPGIFDKLAELEEAVPAQSEEVAA
jgi:exonuclease SbcD